MLLELTSEQEAWISAHVARGDFGSAEDAVRHMIDRHIAECELDETDLAWAKPHVDEARAAVARGESVSLEEHKAFTAALLATLEQ